MLLFLPAFTGPKNAHLVPAANTYVQVFFLLTKHLCSFLLHSFLFLFPQATDYLFFLMDKPHIFSDDRKCWYMDAFSIFILIGANTSQHLIPFSVDNTEQV